MPPPAHVGFCQEEFVHGRYLVAVSESVYRPDAVYSERVSE
jgi:hypothetical protein